MARNALKRDLVDNALREIGESPDDYPIEGGALSFAFDQLEAMVATWFAEGVDLGYCYYDPDTEGDMSIEQVLAREHGMALVSCEAVWTELAKRLCPFFGKEPPGALISKAAMAYRTIARHPRSPRPIRGAVPIGQGNERGLGGRWWGRTFTRGNYGYR